MNRNIVHINGMAMQNASGVEQTSGAGQELACTAINLKGFGRGVSGAQAYGLDQMIARTQARHLCPKTLSPPINPAGATVRSLQKLTL